MTSATSSRRLAALISSLLTGGAIITSSSAFHLPTSTTLRPPVIRLKQQQQQQQQQRLSSLSLSSFASQQYSIDISENAPRDTATVTDWAINYGIQIFDAFQLTTAPTELEDSDGGRNNNNVNNNNVNNLDVYITTNQNIPPETPLLSIPTDLILTGSKSRQELGSQTNGAEYQSLPLSDHQTFYLFLKILREYELGDQSPWYYWLNSLPRYYSNGASMTDFCFGCLPPYAAKLALAEKTRYRQFREVLDALSSSFLTTVSNEGDGDSYYEELTKWAFNVVVTRCVELPGGDCGIVPMVDYLNHGSDPNVYLTYDDVGNCYVYSTREVMAEEPLVFAYGDSSNPSNLLARYGFLDESSSGTFCKYVIENPTMEMFHLGYPNSMLFYNDGSISNEVWDVLLYELLNDVSPDEQQHFYQAHLSGDEGTKASYHDQYFAAAFQSLSTHTNYILNELDELGMGLETQIAQGQDAKRHPRLPLIMRHNEFVRVTFENVRQNLDNMIA